MCRELTVEFKLPTKLIMRDHEGSETTIHYIEGAVGYSRDEDGPWGLKGIWSREDEGDIAGDHYY